MKIIIIGVAISGSSLGKRLRALSEDLEIIIFEKEKDISYAKWGLPLYIKDKVKDSSNLLSETPESYKNRYNIDIRIQSEVVKIDSVNKRIYINDLKTNMSYEESYDKLVIASGMTKETQDIKGIEKEDLFRLENLEDGRKLKNYIENNNISNSVIIGGGFIGLELAQVLNSKNISVTVIEENENILKDIDIEISSELCLYLAHLGIEIITKEKVLAIEKLKATYIINTKKYKIETNMIISTVEKRITNKLLDGTNIKSNEFNEIIVDDYFETSVKDIYAIGSVIANNNFIEDEIKSDFRQTASNLHGILLGNNILGVKEKYEGSPSTFIIKVFNMIVGKVGLTEEELKNLGKDYDKVFIYVKSKPRFHPKAKNLKGKILFEKESGKILGGQIIGYENVDRYIDILSVIIKSNGIYKDLANLELVFASQISSDKNILSIAGNIINNIINHNYKQFHWEDIKGLQEDKTINLIDVREEYEFQKNFLKGFKNIPLDTLRDSLNDIDKNKKVYIVCNTGKRGYIACNILKNNGFDCYNLSGGLKNYNSIEFINEV